MYRIILLNDANNNILNDIILFFGPTTKSSKHSIIINSNKYKSTRTGEVTTGNACKSYSSRGTRAPGNRCRRRRGRPPKGHRRPGRPVAVFRSSNGVVWLSNYCRRRLHRRRRRDCDRNWLTTAADNGGRGSSGL